MKFPCYKNHQDSSCLACGGSFLFYESTEHSPGDGHFKSECRCGLVTWYDITEKPVVESVQALRGLPRSNRIIKVKELTW